MRARITKLFGILLIAASLVGCATAQNSLTVKDLFDTDYQNRLVMTVEAAIASGQADLGIVPGAAAEEIAAKAGTEYAPADEIAAEYAIVRHRMVALLNVWRRSLSPQAADALHLGVTTVDIYDTVLLLQLLTSIDLMLAEMQSIEQALVCLADTHRDTAMIGRTLGQHALPITFGKKVSVWAAQNRRNIDRLYEVRARLRSSGVLKGAVGSYLGLGDQAMELEALVSSRLGLDPPEPADWRPARDVFAEYALTLALIAKSNAAIGGEIYRLQMTDIGEVYERQRASVVGSSTLPHKRNPSLSEALVYSGRTIPALADVVLQDVESVFERDNTSRPNATLGEISIEASEMLARTQLLIDRLEIDEGRMRQNLDLTDGMVMSQKIMLFLSETIRREDAESRVRAAADRSLLEDFSFRAALLNDPVIGPLLEAEIDDLLDPERSLGLASKQVDATLDWIASKRAMRAEANLDKCIN